jgi:hypothetical protein
MRRLNLTFLALLLLVGIPYYWFFLDNGGPDAQAQPITIEQLRSLADAANEAAPQHIHYERVASDSLMGNRIAAGTGLRSERLDTLSFMLAYGNGDAILIGSGISKADSARHGQESYDARAQARVTEALLRARMLIPLYAADDQFGGLKMLSGSAQGKQLDADLAAQRRADANGAPYRVASGVVVIPTPRLRAGSRLVFVRLADGREVLFAGSLAPISQRWRQMRLPSRFVTDLGVREDRGAIRSWLLTLRALHEEAPRLTIVSGSRIPKQSGFTHRFDRP